MDRTLIHHKSDILLIGNGSYQNRGCEAIVRGTMEILGHEFESSLQVQAGVFATPDLVRNQNAFEVDPAVHSFPLTVSGGRRWSLGWWAVQANNRLGASFHPHLKDLKEPAQSAEVALEIGGDHYSLDYGKPLAFMAMDRFFASRKIPVILWGMSIGPFDTDPVFAKIIFKHLGSLAGIFVRESESLNYLRKNGVTENVYLMGDPAFVMKPVEPHSRKWAFPLQDGTIGINLSPMLAFYRGVRPSDVDLEQWCESCADLVRSVATLGRPILLVPHVSSADPGNDDFVFLETLLSAVESDLRVPIHIVPRGLNAAEIKWAISRCAVFAGARTHSTIAALSTHVPTLSIGYSLKARGINKDAYGHLDYCLAVRDLTVASFTERISSLLDQETDIRKQLASSIPHIANLAMEAGPILRQIVVKNTQQ